MSNSVNRHHQKEGLIIYRVKLGIIKPDDYVRSFRNLVESQKNGILSGTSFLIDPEASPSQNLKIFFIVIYLIDRKIGYNNVFCISSFYITYPLMKPISQIILVDRSKSKRTQIRKTEFSLF